MVVKKRSPRDLIEGEKSHKLEHIYVKFPGQNVIGTTLNSEEINTPDGNTISAREDIDKLKLLWKKHNKQYTHIHTHPYSPNDPKLKDRKIRYSPLPSGADMNRFLGDNSVKNMAIAQVNRDTNKLEGYFYLRKSKDTKSAGYSPLDADETMAEIHKMGIIKGIRKIIDISLKQRRVRKDTRKYGKDVIMSQMMDSPEYLFPLVEKLAEGYHLQYRFVPAKEYEVDENKTKFVAKGLESKITATTAILSLLGSIIFLSSNFTGNVIGSQSTSNVVGAVLFLVGIVGAFVYFKRKK